MLNIQEYLDSITMDNLTDKEREIVNIFRGLDKIDRIYAVHNFYDIVFDDIVERIKKDEETVRLSCECEEADTVRI